MKRGEVWIAALIPRSGSEQQGRRPVVILSNDGFNQQPRWKSIIVIPVSTSAGQARHSDTAVPIATGLGGLTRDSVAVCHQITTLDRSKFVERLGVLPAETIGQIEEGVKAALDFPL